MTIDKLISQVTRNNHLLSLIDEIRENSNGTTYKVEFSASGKPYSLTLSYREIVDVSTVYFIYDIRVIFYYNKEINVITIQIYDGATEISTVHYLKFSVDSVIKTVRQTLANLFDREIRINQQKYNSIRKDRI